MQAQIPAKGIMEVETSGDGGKVYHIECDCSCEDHAVRTSIAVSGEADFGVNITFYVKTWTPYDLASGGLWQRVKKAANILFKGVDTQEHDILLKQQAALNWVDAVNGAIDDINRHNSVKVDNEYK